jgi:hypothetical protein
MGAARKVPGGALARPIHHWSDLVPRKGAPPRGPRRGGARSAWPPGLMSVAQRPNRILKVHRPRGAPRLLRFPASASALANGVSFAVAKWPLGGPVLASKLRPAAHSRGLPWHLWSKLSLPCRGIQVSNVLA